MWTNKIPNQHAKWTSKVWICWHWLWLDGSDCGCDSGYIFFNWPVFYSLDGWTLHRKFLLLKATQPPLINVWQYSRYDRHLCFKLVIFQKFENLLKIRYILLYIWFDIMYMVFEYKINIRKLILWNFFTNTKENPQKWPKIQNNHLHEFFLFPDRFWNLFLVFIVI